MKILHLETSSRNCSVAISEGETLLAFCEEVSENYKQSERLHSFIHWTLQGAEIEPKDLDGISLGIGPGSYTGLRIGAASAKGLCFSLETPLVAVHSMQSMVEPFLEQGYECIIPLIDARRMEVYSAVFHGETGEMISETEAKILDEESYQEFKEKKILFVGDGAEKAQEILKLPLAKYVVEVYPSAQYQIKKAVEKYKAKNFEDIAYFEPFYLKDFQGVKKKNKK